MPLRDRTTWLHGDRFHCLQPPPAVGRTWRLVLLGPPGVGKGTQASFLSTVLGACPLSTGDIFRAARDRAISHSEMVMARQHVDRGELVPDDIMLQVIHNRRTCLGCHAGFLLDGFPRTIAQAATLDGMLEADHIRLDAAIAYELPASLLAARLAGRRVCQNCQAPYHLVTHPPKTAGKCDWCGGTLAPRPDDEPAAIHARLAAYYEATALVTDYYRRQGLLITVPAFDSPEVVFARVLDLLADRGFDVPLPRPPSAPAGHAPPSVLNPVSNEVP